MTTPATSVSVLLPLALLEAVRNIDTPIDDGLDDPIEDRGKARLGMSPTVALQIERYQEQAELGEDLQLDEALGVFRLIGRRVDAALVYADAGRRAARHAADRAGVGTKVLQKMPLESLARRAGQAEVTRLARAIFAAEHVPSPVRPVFTMTDSLAMAAMPDGGACGFYGAAFGELLRVLVGYEGVLVHDECVASGAPRCHWRGERADGYE